MRSGMIWRPILVLGVVILSISVFLLPWIRFWNPQVADARLRDFISNEAVFRAVSALPPAAWDQAGVSLSLTPSGVSVKFAQPHLQALLQIARTHEVLSAWSLWYSGVPLAGLLRVCFFLLFIIAVAAAVLLFAHIATGGIWLVRVGLGVLGIAAIVLLLLLLVNLPDIDTLGSRGDLAIAFVCWLTGSRPGVGIYVALLGLLLIAGAAAIGCLVEPVAREAQQDESDTPISSLYN